MSVSGKNLKQICGVIDLLIGKSIKWPKMSYQFVLSHNSATRYYIFIIFGKLENFNPPEGGGGGGGGGAQRGLKVKNWLKMPVCLSEP